MAIKNTNTKAGLSATSRFADVLHNAILNNGSILELDENDPAVKALTKHRLVYTAQHNQESYVHSHLRDLVNFLNAKEVFREMAGAFADRIHALEQDIEMYHVASKKNPNSSEKYFQQVNEDVIDIQELLKIFAHSLHNLINNDFGTAPIEERTLLLERCRREIDKIVRVFEELSLSALSQLSAGSHRLEALLHTFLKREIDTSLNDIKESNKALVQYLEILVTEQEMVKKNRLIDRFYELFNNDMPLPNLQVDFDSLPESLLRPAPLHLTGHPNFHSHIDENKLQQYAINIHERANLPPVTQEKDYTRNVDTSPEQEEQTSIPKLFDAAEHFFDALRSGQHDTLSAADCFSILYLDTLDDNASLEKPINTVDDFLLLIDTYIQSQDLTKEFIIEYVQTTDEHFTGTVFIEDIVFSLSEVNR